MLRACLAAIIGSSGVSLISAPICTGRSPGSQRSMRLTPDSPASRRCQVPSAESARAVSAPSPVTTTRRRPWLTVSVIAAVLLIPARNLPGNPGAIVPESGSPAAATLWPILRCRNARRSRRTLKDAMDITISLDPILLEVGGVAILRWYSLAITIAIFAAVWLIDREFKRKGMDTSHYGGIATWTIILGIIGARLFHVIDDWDFYSANPERIIQIQRGGLAIWGATILGALGVYI